MGSPLQDTLWEAPAEGLTRTLCPSQMWTSVWRGPTAATSMLSARTPHARTSASASPATRGTANTAKVRLGGTCTGGPAGGGGAVPAWQVAVLCFMLRPAIPTGTEEGWRREKPSFLRELHFLLCTSWAGWGVGVLGLRPEVARRWILPACPQRAGQAVCPSGNSYRKQTHLPLIVKAMQTNSLEM